MKSGVGDPFDEPEEEPESDEQSKEAEPGESDESQEAEGAEAAGTTGDAPGEGSGEDADTAEDAPAEEESAEDEGGRDASQYPLTFRRDNVKDERPNVHQLFVQDATDSAARAAERELEDRLDEDVYRLDAREAMYLAGIRNLDGAEEILREWGYDL